MGTALAVVGGIFVLFVAAAFVVWSRGAKARPKRRLSGMGSAYGRGRVKDRRALWARRYGAGGAWAAGGIGLTGAHDDGRAGSDGGGSACGTSGCGGGCGGGGCGGGGGGCGGG